MGMKTCENCGDRDVNCFLFSEDDVAGDGFECVACVNRRIEIVTSSRRLASDELCATCSLDLELEPFFFDRLDDHWCVCIPCIQKTIGDRTSPVVQKNEPDDAGRSEDALVRSEDRITEGLEGPNLGGEVHFKPAKKHCGSRIVVT
jgi:hypothetical protein